MAPFRPFFSRPFNPPSSTTLSPYPMCWIQRLPLGLNQRLVPTRHEYVWCIWYAQILNSMVGEPLLLVTIGCTLKSVDDAYLNNRTWKMQSLPSGYFQTRRKGRAVLSYDQRIESKIQGADPRMSTWLLSAHPKIASFPFELRCNGRFRNSGQPS